MFRAIFCPSSGAWDWDIYSIWYPVVVVGYAAAHRLPAHHNNRIPYAVNISVSRSWWWAKYCPKHVEPILQINKSLLHLVGSSVLLYTVFYSCDRYKCELSYVIFCTTPQNAYLLLLWTLHWTVGHGKIYTQLYAIQY